MRVIIIGGGTGGMCLAHGLKRAGVPVEVYERYGSRSDGLYGYRVGIDPTGNRALKQCLSPELFDIFAATCARPPRHFNVYTQGLRRTASFDLAAGEPAAMQEPDPVNTERSVSRAVLRQVLFTGMDDVVHFGKVYTRYERNPDGTVTAFFADGTSAVGDVLVSAEGTRSAVRAQYLPHATVKDTGITAVTTKTPLTPETLALLPREARDGLSLIFGTKRVMGILHVMVFPWDAAGRPKDPADAPLLERWAEMSGAKPGELAGTGDYINLAFWTTDERVPADTARRRGAELVRLALDSTRHWDPRLRRIFELSDPAAAFPVKIATSVPVPPWQSTNITLLGDAAHTMTPGQGVGANTALRDAALLCRELVAAHEGRKKPVEAIADYEAEMIPYGFDRVRESLKNNGTTGDDPLYKPVLGRLTLFAARSFFAANSRVPALRRRFLHQLQASRGAGEEYGEE